VFRDSRGVVHTVSSPDPLDDLPPSAGTALAGILLVPTEGDLGGAVERCEAVMELLDRWQDAFFAALPTDIDLDEEARWAAEAGLSLDDVEDDWSDEDDSDDDEGEESPGQIGLDEIDLAELTPFDGEPHGLFDLGPAADGGPLSEAAVSELERALLLLPMRTRLEALVAASALVAEWSDLLADHEKCLGHLVLQHGLAPGPHPHEVLADQHAMLHAGQARHARPA
jgi:hypothetical protein